MQRLTIVLAAVGLLGAARKAASAAKAAGKAKRIVLISGRPSHGRGSHAWDAGVKLLKHCLDTSPNVKGITTDLVFHGWPKDTKVLDEADTIVLLSDGDGGHPIFRNKDRIEHIDRLARRGVGLAFIHYAVAPGRRNEAKLLEWIGGCYKNGYSKNPHNTVEVPPGTKDHPICRGWKPFVATDEFYYRIWFGEDPKRMVPIMTAMLPKNKPVCEPIAWAVERKDGGRGFGFTGVHFHKNWKIEDFRKMVLNAIVWTAKIEVPKAGVQSSLGDKDFLKDERK